MAIQIDSHAKKNAHFVTNWTLISYHGTNKSYL